MNNEAIEQFAEKSVLKTFLLGVPVSLALGLLVSVHFGASVFAGVALAAGNLAAIAWLGRRILERASAPDEEDKEEDAEGQRASPTPWVVLLVLKMGLLLGLAFAAMAMGVDPLGLAVGYSVFVAAMVWQALLVAVKQPRDS
jgi:Na+/H+ antiporter NhaD/arsenite permease-like protein